MALDFFYRVACSASSILWKWTKKLRASGGSAADIRWDIAIMLCVLLSHCIEFKNLWANKEIDIALLKLVLHFSYNLDCYSSKIFRIFWLAPIPRLIFRNLLALTKFGRGEQYTIVAMVYVIENEAVWVYPKTKSLNFWLKMNGINVKTYAKHIVRWIISTFWGLSARKKKHLFISWNRVEK